MAAAAAARFLISYLRTYPLAPRYRRSERLTLTTEDGVRLTAARLAGPPDALATVVVVHGFANRARHPQVVSFARELARTLDVIVPDLRGHGRSGGECTLGPAEVADVDAAVRTASPARPVAVVGVSMGAAAAVLQAASRGGVAGVVAVSAPAFPERGRPGSGRVSRWVSSPWRRVLLRLLIRTRVAERHGLPRTEDHIASVAPAFTVIVHDRTDSYFGPEHAERLYERAAEPKELWWVVGGHGVDLLTTELARRVTALLEQRLPADR